MNNPLAIYIHWPFCKSKCPYCDFNSHVRDQIDSDEWENAYLREIDYFSDIISGREIVSIFFGGGTPSLMPPRIVATILDRLAQKTKFSSKIEITLEANPTSVEVQNFYALRAAGVNRLSLGIQSLNDQALHFLGRTHSANQAIEAINLAKSIFPRYSFDLIYALPNQTLKHWENELVSALKLCDKHISLYQLTIEKGTKFFSQHKKGEFILPDENLATDMYDLTQDITTSYNLPSYEISNHASLGEESIHNMVYWTYQDFLGIGPGAHSRINGSAMVIEHLPEKWLEKVSKYGAGIKETIPLSKNDQIKEFILMGLRIRTGINLFRFRNIFGQNLVDITSLQKFEYLQNLDLIECTDDYLRATKQGMLVINKIVETLVSDLA